MPDPRDRVDLSGAPPQAAPPGCQPLDGHAPRLWLSLFFRCSNRYTRAYRDPDGAGYTGRCPRCGKAVRFAVGVGGTDRRSFEISC